jgi:hypothetical protein
MGEESARNKVKLKNSDMKKLLTLVILLVFFGSNAQDIYLHCGKLIDTKNGKVLSEKTIVVSGNKITSIEDGYINPKKP